MDGKVLPAFKGRTLDFVSVPRTNKSQILSSDLAIKKDNKIPKEKKKIGFHIDSTFNLKDIMSSQSTGRRRINTNEQ